MSLDGSLITSIERKVQAAQRILVVSHIRPDGDAIGSLLGLGLTLQASGKKVQMVSADGVPKAFRHLKGSDQVLNYPEGKHDLICVVDCSDLKRVGGTLNGYSRPDLNIDHHRTNLNFADINLVDTSAVATAEILSDIILELELPLTQSVAAALLTGLITDTLGFRTANMTPKALRTAASLMERGVDLSELYREVLVKRSYVAARLWGVGLSNLERDGRMVWTTLTMADRETVNYSGRDDADLINMLSSIDEADIAMIFMEQPNGRVKISRRSKPGYDVSTVALTFGGGGHPNASGADIEGDLEEVLSTILTATRPILDENDRILKTLG